MSDIQVCPACESPMTATWLARFSDGDVKRCEVCIAANCNPYGAARELPLRKRELLEAGKELTRVSDDLEKATTALAAAHAQIAALKVEVAAMMKERDAEIAAHAETKTQWNRDYQEARAERDAVVDAADETAHTLREQLNQARADRDELAAVCGQVLIIEALCSGEEMIGPINHAAVQAMLDMYKRAEEYKAKYGATRAELDENHDVQCELLKQANDARDQRDAALADLSELRSQYAFMEGVRDRLQNELSKVAVERDTAVADLSKARADISEQVIAYDDLESKFHIVENERDAAVARAEAAEAQTGESERRIVSRDGMIDDERAAHAATKAQLAQANETIAHVDKLGALREERLRNTRAELASAREEIARLRLEVDGLRTINAEFDDCEEHKAKLGRAVAALREAKKWMGERVMDLDDAHYGRFRAAVAMVDAAIADNAAAAEAYRAQQEEPVRHTLDCNEGALYNGGKCECGAAVDARRGEGAK